MNPGTPLVVAVDGPSGSGKSSVSRSVAARLGLAYLDTGAMYRAITWWCLELALDLHDTPAVAAAAREAVLVMGTDPAAPTVRVGRSSHPVDVTEAVRAPRISAAVSGVATNLEVRAELKRRQREIIAAAEPGIVAEGRDITTVVAPDARVRVLLTASEESRLARRAAQDSAAGSAQSHDDTRDQVLRRDRQDATVSQFLTAADGVAVLDSSDLTFEQTVDALVALVESATARQSTATQT